MEKEHNLLPLTIQLFNDEGGEEANQEETVNETVLKSDYDKLKKLYDKASSEIANFKKEKKEKLSEEEKAKQNQVEKEEEISNLKKELQSIKISKTLIGIGFEEKVCQNLIDKFQNSENIDDFFSELSTQTKKLIDNVRKEEKDKFQQSGTYPPLGSENNNESYGKKKAKETKNKSEEFVWGRKK